MGLERLLEKVNVKSLLGRSIYKEVKEFHGKFGLEIYQSRLTGKQVIANSGGKILFGGVDYKKGSFFSTHRELFFFIDGINNSDFGFYDIYSKRFNSVTEAILDDVKTSAIEYGLWDRLVKSSDRIYSNILGFPENNAMFLEYVAGTYLILADRSEDNPGIQKKSLSQFVQGLEYFADNPDDALGFVGGGLGR